MSWYSRLRNTFRTGRVDSDLDEEMRFHLDMRAAEYEQQGLAPQEARRRAIRRFGNPLVVRERVRDVRLLAWIDGVRQDAWHGVRLLRRSPVLAFTALVSLGLGIGATTGVFAVGDALMLRPLPVQRPGDLMVAQWQSTEWPDLGVWGTNDADNNNFSFSYPLFERLATTPGIDLAGVQDLNHAVISVRGNAANADGAIVTGNLFRVLGLVPAAGRLLEGADNTGASEPVVVISHRFWQNAFGGAAGAVGSAIQLNGRSFTVVGVAPRGFFGTMPGRWADFYVPASWVLQLKPEFSRDSPLSGERFWWLQLIGRPAPGTDLQRLQAAMAVRFDASVKPLIKNAKQHAAFSLRPGAQGYAFVEAESYQPIGILMSLVVLVLLIACSNVANLLLARGAARGKEAAMRLALRAGRWRLVRQHLTESLVVAALGGLAGSLFARWFAQAILAMAPGRDAVVVELGFTGRVFVYGVTPADPLTIGAASGLLLGVAALAAWIPARRAASIDPVEALRCE